MKKIISMIMICTLLLSSIGILNVSADQLEQGLYNFVSADGGRYLNVYAGTDKNGTNVCVWEEDGSPEQKFKLVDTGGNSYMLYPQSSNGRVVDVNRGKSYSDPLKAGLNVDLWETNDLEAQIFYIDHRGSGNYTIELKAKRGLVLTVHDGNKNNGNVTVENYTGASNQHWKLYKDGKQVQPCNHSSTSKINENTIYVKTVDTQKHNVETTYDLKCNSCGTITKTGEKQTSTEQHTTTVAGETCSKCGFKQAENSSLTTTPTPTASCKHDHTSQTNIKTTYVKNNDDAKSHGVNNTFDVICNDCGEIVLKQQTNTSTEGHSFNGNKCIKCDYQKAFAEYTVYANPGVGYRINIRSSASTSSSVVIQANHGDGLTVIGEIVDGFYPVRFSDKTGYASKDFVSTSKPVVFQEYTAYANPGSGYKLNIRAGASTSTAVVIKANHGDALIITGDATSGFYPVKYSGKTGYASTSYVSTTKPNVTNLAPTTNKNFIWPVVNSSRITCNFYGYTNHGGIDIGGNPSGTSMKIVASKGGTVTVANMGCSHDHAKQYNCGCGGGYGRYIKINHGDGTETVYAHLRSISISSGQKVTQGQEIGMMGTTGWSSGVHLHFEIRVNGVKKDPQLYVKP